MIVKYAITVKVKTPGVSENIQDVTLEYNSEDPLAVTMRAGRCSHNNCDECEAQEVVWRFGRSILAEAMGTHEVVGIGDVKALMWDTRLTLFLTAWEWTATVIFPKERVSAFLNETFELVPVHDESLVFDTSVDALLSELLGGE